MIREPASFCYNFRDLSNFIVTCDISDCGIIHNQSLKTIEQFSVGKGGKSFSAFDFRHF